MQIENYPFEQLPFSKLFRTYVTDYSRLALYYPANPFEPGSIEDHTRHFTFKGNREKTVELLQTFNKRFGLDGPVLENIQRLKDEQALALVTGQQLGLYGGPFFAILKIISTIKLATTLENRLDRPVIPVFWLADEDHDYDEIKEVKLLDRDEITSLSLENRKNSYPPVAEIRLSNNFDSFREQVKEELPGTDFSDRLWKLLDSCYNKGSRLDEAFGKLIGNLFSKYGLVLAGSNWKPIKEEARESMKLAIRRADEIRKVLEDQSKALEKEFHRQATIYDSNLFYLDEEKGRAKIVRNGGNWKTESGKKWITGDLLHEIDEYPGRFSPNVFLRPILQDMLIPSLGYVAGPGELAYYGQMKRMYEEFDRHMPIIFPRMSATVIEPPIARILAELPFEVSDYGKRIEDLESEYVDQAGRHDIEAIFSEWKQKTEKISGANTSEIKEIDPTLEGAAGKATAVYFGELDKLKGKVYRTVKQKEETQLKRIRRIKANLFPRGTLQERSISFIYFMNKFGIDIWDRLLEELDENETFARHKLIYL